MSKRLAVAAAGAAAVTVVVLVARLAGGAGRARPEAGGEPAAPGAEAPGADARAVPAGAARGSVEHAARAPRADERVEAADALLRVELVGRCVDGDGAPVAAASVALRDPERATASGPDGAFRFELALDPERAGQVLALTARADDHRDAAAEVRAAAGLVDAGDLVLRRAGALFGRVTDDRGAGLAGAEVLATAPRHVGWGDRLRRPGGELASARTDAHGAFRLDGLAPGSVRLWAGAEGWLWTYHDDVEVAAGREGGPHELALEPLADEHTITLVVVDPSGAPVPRAPVQYRWESGGGSGSGGATADADGRLTHAVTRRVPHDFAARDPEGRLRPAAARGVPPGARDVVLALAPARDLVLRVRDEHGRPVPAFTATFRARVEDRVLRGERARPPAGGTPGEVVVPLPVETFEVEVDADGFARKTAGPHDPDAVGDVLTIELQSLPGVHGLVVDARGDPVPGGRVTLHAGVSEDTELVVNGFPSRSQRGAASSAGTDEDGRFHLTLRADGDYYVRAEAPGYAPAEVGPLALAASAGASGLELVVGAGGLLVGRVRGAGAAVAGRVVGVSRGDGFGVTQRTDDEGRYRFERLTPGPWYVELRREELRSGSTTSSSSRVDEPRPLPWSCAVHEGGTTRHDLDLDVHAAVVVDGRLTLAGLSTAGWSARLTGTDTDAREVTAQLDGDGRFGFDLSEAGSYSLTVHGALPGDTWLLLHASLDLAAGVNRWHREVPTGGLEGHAASLGEGERIQLAWTGSDGLAGWATLDPASDGRFALAAFPAGTVRVQRRRTDGTTEDLRTIVLAAGSSTWVDLP